MDLIELKRRLAEIDGRLSNIEKHLNLELPAKQQEKETYKQLNNPWSQTTTASNQRVQPTPEKPGNWLGIVSVLCFVLAAGFIVKLSIESGWLTPVRQIGLAALLGFILIGTGFTLMRTDREYASLLPGAGVIVLYLASFAAHRYYGLVSYDLALALIAIISGLCIGIYTKIRHDVYAITAAVGAYVSPIILGLNTGAAFSLYYFLFCSVTFAAISVWVASRTLTVVSAYLALFSSAVIGIYVNFASTVMGAYVSQDQLLAVLLPLHFLVFAVGTYAYSRHNNMALNTKEAWSFLPVLLAFYALEYYFIERIMPQIAPWVSLGFAAILIGLYMSAKKYFPENHGSQFLTVAFTTVVCFHSIYLELLPDSMHSILFILLMLAATFVTLPHSKGDDPVYTLPKIALLLIIVIEYFGIVFDVFDGAQGHVLVVAFAALASIWMLIVSGRNEQINAKYGHTLLAAAHALAVLALYQLTRDAGSLAVSASWLFYAVGVMALAFTRKDEVMAKSALFVLAFAAGKALLYDAASAPTVVRIFCLLLTGAVLYGCGLLMRKIAGWQEK